MSERMVIDIIFEASDFENDIPQDPKGFIEYWQEIVGLIPEEYLDSTTITIENEYVGSEERELTLTVSRKRPETTTEKARREDHLEREENVSRLRELAQLEMLKEKYENSGGQGE